MTVLDFAWDTATSVGQRDHDSLRLILDAALERPILTSDNRGYVMKLPVPRAIDGGFYSLHGLYCDQEAGEWVTLWRLFRASLYHLALHVGYSDFPAYASWARGKELKAVTYSVSLIEDLYAIRQARTHWQGLLPDIAYSNFVSSLRIPDTSSIADPAVRYATRLLLEAWGVNRLSKPSDTDIEIQALAERLHSAAAEAVKKKGDERRSILTRAANEVYGSVVSKGQLTEVPSMPYTELHGKCSLFESKLVGDPKGQISLISASRALGIEHDPEDAESKMREGKQTYVEVCAYEQKLSSIRSRYEDLIKTTRLAGVGYPAEDYGMFLRTRSELSGPIRGIRDQLRQLKNVLDETPGLDVGQLDMQAAVQMVASNKVSTDVFVGNELSGKDEAWAILLDASKSVSASSHETRGIAVCLSEVAKELIPRRNQWGVYAFNNSFRIIKDFDEDYGTAVKARIGGLEQRSSTLLPDAMRTAFKALAAKPVDVKIMVVVSDGYPTGYQDIEGELIHTIKEISQTGTFLIGVGVDSKAIEDYFAVNCVVGSPYQMMKSFVKSYLQLANFF